MFCMFTFFRHFKISQFLSQLYFLCHRNCNFLFGVNIIPLSQYPVWSKVWNVCHFTHLGLSSVQNANDLTAWTWIPEIKEMPVFSNWKTVIDFIQITIQRQQIYDMQPLFPIIYTFIFIKFFLNSTSLCL